MSTRSLNQIDPDASPYHEAVEKLDAICSDLLSHDSELVLIHHPDPTQILRSRIGVIDAAAVVASRERGLLVTIAPGPHFLVSNHGIASLREDALEIHPVDFMKTVHGPVPGYKIIVGNQAVGDWVLRHAESDLARAIALLVPE